MPRLFLVLLMIAGTALGSTAATAQKYRTKIAYYAVTGSSIAQIHQRMNSPDHYGAYATISQDLDLKGSYQQGKSCRLKGFSIPSTFTVRLPKLSGGNRLDKRSRARFAAFQKYLRWHEFKHRSIWIGCLKRIERRSRRLRAKNCSVLDSKVLKVFEVEGARCNRLHARFDKGQRKRINSHVFVKTAARQLRQPSRTRQRRVSSKRSSTPRQRSNLGASNR
ncbi:MAG: DUF922 domain-containing protein [Pseudomonadota bacterium]